MVFKVLIYTLSSGFYGFDTDPEQWFLLGWIYFMACCFYTLTHCNLKLIFNDSDVFIRFLTSFLKIVPKSVNNSFISIWN